jgi:NADPH-dependent curcumin reductase CurA
MFQELLVQLELLLVRYSKISITAGTESFVLYHVNIRLLLIVSIFRVIGSTGSDDKVKYLVDTLKFDAAFNYKTEDPVDALKRLAPTKIDLFFDNVGGKTLDAALGHMSFGGRVITCGAIETYNDVKGAGVEMKNMFQIIISALTIQGYLISQFQNDFDAGVQELIQWYESGLLIIDETYLHGLSEAPNAMIGLMNGKNTGKMFIRLSDDEDIATSLKSDL